MDGESGAVVRFLRGVDTARARLQDTLGEELRRRGVPAVAQAFVMPMARPEAGGSVEAVSIHLTAVKSAQMVFEFWIDAVALPDRWLVEAHVLADAKYGQERIHAFPDRVAGTVDECAAAMAEAASDLASVAHLVEEHQPE